MYLSVGGGASGKIYLKFTIKDDLFFYWGEVGMIATG